MERGDGVILTHPEQPHKIKPHRIINQSDRNGEKTWMYVY